VIRVGPLHWGFAVRKQVHHCIVDDGIRQGVAADIAALRVPLEKLEIRDEYAVSITAGEEVVGVGHVYDGSAFDAVLVAGVESDVVLDVKFPKSFVFLQREAEQITKCESILVVCIDEEVASMMRAGVSLMTA
jgi:hypothetical protein